MKRLHLLFIAFLMVWTLTFPTLSDPIQYPASPYSRTLLLLTNQSQWQAAVGGGGSSSTNLPSGQVITNASLIGDTQIRDAFGRSGWFIDNSSTNSLRFSTDDTGIVMTLTRQGVFQSNLGGNNTGGFSFVNSSVDTNGNASFNGSLAGGTLNIASGAATIDGGGNLNVIGTATVGDLTAASVVAAGGFNLDGAANAGVQSDGASGIYFIASGNPSTHLSNDGNFSAISFSGDGSLVTNIQSTNIIRTLTQTNIVIGQLYTNTTSGYRTICGLSAALVEAAVAGRSSVQVAVSGQFTNTLLAAITSAVGTIVGSDTNALPTIIVPSGSTYKFTDTSTGAGNSATLVGGQIFQ